MRLVDKVKTRLRSCLSTVLWETSVTLTILSTAISHVLQKNPLTLSPTFHLLSIIIQIFSVIFALILAFQRTIENQAFSPFSGLKPSEVPRPVNNFIKPNSDTVSTSSGQQASVGNATVQTVNAIQDPSSNFNAYHKSYYPKVFKNEVQIRETFPLLKNFKPKFTKRENVDKKILRKYKQYLKDKYKTKSINIQNEDKHFWVMFINGNLFPPMKYREVSSNDQIDFKSFNTKFMAWLFSKIGAIQLYEDFIKHKLEEVLEFIVQDYNVREKEEIDQLKYYITNLALIFGEPRAEPIQANISQISMAGQSTLEMIKSNRMINKEDSFEVERERSRNMDEYFDFGCDYSSHLG